MRMARAGPSAAEVKNHETGAVSFAEPQTTSQPKTQTKTLEQIENEKGKIRGEMGNLERHQLRIIPELHFHLDETIDRMERIDELLKS